MHRDWRILILFDAFCLFMICQLSVILVNTFYNREQYKKNKQLVVGRQSSEFGCY